MQINEEVCIKRSTVGTLGSVDCLLKHTFINNLSHDTWLTVTEYLCYTSPRICPVLLSSSGEETDYHSGIPELTQVSSCNGMNAVDLYIIYETKRGIKESVQLCEKI
jgi:hypothetical protein